MLDAGAQDASVAGFVGDGVCAGAERGVYADFAVWVCEVPVGAVLEVNEDEVALRDIVAVVAGIGVDEVASVGGESWVCSVEPDEDDGIF